MRHAIRLQGRAGQGALSRAAPAHREPRLRRILAVAPNWIGDALMAQPLFRRLHEKLGAVSIDILAPPWVAPIARRMPEVDAVIEAPFRHGVLELRARWKLGRSLRARRYDQAIVLPNTWKSALTPFFADIPIRSGYVGESRYGLLNLVYPLPQEPAPMAVHYAQLSEAPGTPPAEPLPAPRLRVDAGAARATADRFGLAPRYAVFCPGAEYGAAKRWPYFRELAAGMDLPVVLIGAAGDRATCEGIEARNLAGETTLDEAIDIIALAAFVVTNDSGLMHATAALDRPQVALFGSSSPQRTPPMSAQARVVWLRPQCSPCFARECPLGHFRCMREIAVDRVREEIKLLTRERVPY